MVESLADKAIQLYMENDYDYLVSNAKAGFKMPERTDDQMIQFLKRNSIVPANMPEEDIQKVADIAIKRIDEIEAEVYKKYQLK